jgi:heat shock protein HtpX
MWEAIRANQRRAAVLVVVMAALLFAVGYALGELVAPGAGAVGLALAFVLWMILTLIAYTSGDRVFLALSRARRISKQDHPVLYNVVEEMCIAAGLASVPDIYIIDDAAPNAFATGRSAESASIAVTAGLLEMMDRDELQGVVAHELGHVVNRDVLYVMLVGVMMGAVVMLADVGVRALFWGGGRRRTSRSGGGQAEAILLLVAVILIILAPILAQLVYFALSRRREYLADACSALYTRYPEGLASALEKLSRSTLRLRSATRATAPMYIVNPLAVSAKGLADLTSTHPPLSARIKVLRSMAGQAGLDRYDEAFRRVTGQAVGVVPFSALQDASAVPTAAAKKPQLATRTERVRAATDALWRLNGFLFVACSCGTSLKVPPAYLGRDIPCPHCGTVHRIGPEAVGERTG